MNTEMSKTKKVFFSLLLAGAAIFTTTFAMTGKAFADDWHHHGGYHGGYGGYHRGGWGGYGGGWDHRGWDHRGWDHRPGWDRRGWDHRHW